jgi:hypothetical protein
VRKHGEAGAFVTRLVSLARVCTRIFAQLSSDQQPNKKPQVLNRLTLEVVEASDFLQSPDANKVYILFGG